MPRNALRFAVAAGFCGFALTVMFGPVSAGAQSRSQESKRVYSTVFDSLFHQGRERPRALVIFDSTSWDANSVAYKGTLNVPHKSAIDSALVADFEQQNPRSKSISKSDFSYPIPIAMLSLSDLYRLDTLGRQGIEKREAPYVPSKPAAMYALADKYRGVWGITSVSRVGFDATMKHALVLVSHNCGICYSSDVFYLIRKHRKWKIAERIPFRSQDGIGPGEIRYVGLNPQFLPRLRKTQDSTRKAVADSLRRDRLPRRIRGVAKNGITGKPFAGANIELRSHKVVVDLKDTVPDIRQRRVTDSKGRFEFRNPQIGLSMLALECPGTGESHTRVLEGRDFFLFAATDTVVNLVAPDLRPCWPGHVHQIESGELASTPPGVGAAESDDADVIAAVVASLYPASSGSQERAVVTQRTYQRCRQLAECPSLRFEAFIKNGTLDSSTVKDFLARSKVVRAFTLQQSGSADFSLLADGERRYLESAAWWIDYGQDEPEGRRFWKALAINHPSAGAILSFTLPGFNRLRSEAMVELTTESLDHWKERETILLRKAGGRWSIARRHVENDIVSGRISGGKCEPVAPEGVPTLSQLSTINGEYLFSFISDTGDGETFSWRARFIPDTSALLYLDLGRISPDKRDLIIKQTELAFKRRDHSIPIFEVLDPKTGERRQYADAGNYVQSAGRMFGSKSGMLQFDGSGYFIDIRSVEKDALFGMWQAFSFGVRVGRDGFIIPEPSGHFCGRRLESAH